jgi:hypothetical protein
MCMKCGLSAGYTTYPDTYTYDKMWHKCKHCGTKWTTPLPIEKIKKEKPVMNGTRIDLTPRNLTQPNEPLTFFNHLEEATINDDELRILRDVTRLYNYAAESIQKEISLKILKIRIVRNTHKITLKFSKDIVEYLDTILK